MARSFFRLSFACIVLCTLSVAAAAQTTINVPADQPTIQAAISAANNGDTVVVAPGTYFENLNFSGKFITVTSSNGPAVTIIDAGGLGPVVTFDTNEGTNSVLNGFTLQNGVASQSWPTSGTGAGILILNTSPTITGNVITGNHAICGIGTEIQGGSPVIRGNTITGNTQAGGDGGCGGGGIEITGDSTHPPAAPQITGNTITNNSLAAGGFGGGIEVSYFSSPIIQNNYIAGNSVYNSGGGINVQSYLNPVVVQNIIVNNSAGAGGSGGGIAVSSPATVVSNTIVDNTAFDGSSGIFADRFPPITISNNIVVAASAQTGIVCSPFSSTFPTFSHNDVLSPGDGPPFSSNCASADGTNGNISVDPQFVNPANGDYHLQAASPAIDAGDNNAPSLLPQDYEGNPRIAAGNATTCSNTIDIGAYEFVLTTTSAATLSPAALDFGAITVGTSSGSQTVTFSATQGCVAKPAITASGDYHETDNCTSALGSGASCSIQVTFSPTTSGTRTGSLAVTSGNISASTSLTGQGLPGVLPAISVSPASITFANQLLGTTAAYQTITVSNSGSAPLHVNALSVTGDTDLYTVTNNCVGGAGTPSGGSCTIQIGFTPRSTGPGSATLSIASDAPTSPTNVPLSGTGVDAAPTLSPASISFGNQLVNASSAAQTVTLTNTNSAALQINSISITGDFSQSNNCPASVGANSSCVIQITFRPVTTGARSGAISVATNSVPSSTAVSLSGTGVQPAISVSPGSIAFGDQVLNTTATSQTITVSNPGTGTLYVSALSISGDADLATATNNCVGGTGIAPGGSCTIQIGFTPHSLGAASATLSITSDAPTSPTSVSLSGNGVNAAPTLSPTTLSFGNVLVGRTSGSQTITMTANGSAALTLSSITVSAGFVQNNNCLAMLTPGSGCSIVVSFKPLAVGAVAGTLTIVDNAYGGSQTVPLSGNGVDFSVSASPASVSVNVGQKASYAVTVSPVGGSYNGNVALSCSGLPTGTKCSFSPNGISPGSNSVNSTLTVSTTHAQPGTYTFTINGTANSTTHSTTVGLVVN